MGLGKTLQTISLFAYLKENHAEGKQALSPLQSSKIHLVKYLATQDPHLVICPLSVLQSWEAVSLRHSLYIATHMMSQQECARWAPSLDFVRYHGAVTERERIRHLPVNFDIMLTTYDAYVTDHKWFKTRRWSYCVLDEGHKIKNSETQVSQSMNGLGSLYRLSEYTSGRTMPQN